MLSSSSQTRLSPCSSKKTRAEVRSTSSFSVRMVSSNISSILWSRKWRGPIFGIFDSFTWNHPAARHLELGHGVWGTPSSDHILKCLLATLVVPAEGISEHLIGPVRHAEIPEQKAVIFALLRVFVSEMNLFYSWSATCSTARKMCKTSTKLNHQSWDITTKGPKLALLALSSHQRYPRRTIGWSAEMLVPCSGCELGNSLEL